MAQIQNPDSLVVRIERPDQPAVRALLGDLDTYLASLYALQDNHILSEDELLAPQVRFVVARRDGRVCGCGALRHMPGEPATGGEDYGEIKRMMVEPAARGRGVGAALLMRLEALMFDDGLRLALLETGAEQRDALRLYERAGYARRGAFAGYPDNGLSLFLHKRIVQ